MPRCRLPPKAHPPARGPDSGRPGKVARGGRGLRKHQIVVVSTTSLIQQVAHPKRTISPLCATAGDASRPAASAANAGAVATSSVGIPGCSRPSWYAGRPVERMRSRPTAGKLQQLARTRLRRVRFSWESSAQLHSPRIRSCCVHPRAGREAWGVVARPQARSSLAVGA